MQQLKDHAHGGVKVWPMAYHMIIKYFQYWLDASLILFHDLVYLIDINP